LDHLIPAVLNQQQQQRSSGSGNSSNGRAVVVADAMEEEGVEALDASGGFAASPAAVMLQQVVSAVMSAVQGAAAAAGSVAGDAAAAAAVAAAGPQGAAAPGALPSDLKRLKYLIHCLPAIRRQGSLGTAFISSILAAPAAALGAGEPGTAAAAASEDDASQAAVAAAATAARMSVAPGWVEAVPAAAAGAGLRVQRRLPKPCRVFLAALMQEVRSLVEVEQPTAIRECLGSLLGDLAGLFAAPAALLLPASAAVDAAAAGDRSSGGGAGSGCSSPIEIDVPAAADAAGEAGDGGVLLLNSSLSGLRAQAALLLQQAVQRFAVHAAQLELLKNSGAGGGGANISASSSSGNLQQQRASDNSDDAVMVDAADAAASAGAVVSEQQRGSSNDRGLSLTPDDGLTQSLTHCGVGLQMLIAAIESGETGSLRPLLAAMLPGVLQLQELSGPGLQQLSGEAKAAFVLYKYVPFSAAHVKGVAGAVLGAGGSEAWSSRAAAMVFLQVFWFRHCYQLGTEDMEQLQVRPQAVLVAYYVY
jgi:hypothetical protein